MSGWSYDTRVATVNKIVLYTNYIKMSVILHNIMKYILCSHELEHSVVPIFIFIIIINKLMVFFDF